MANTQKKKNSKLPKILIPVIVVVLIAVALVVVLLLPESTGDDSDSTAATQSYADVQQKVDNKKEHQANIEKDKDGNIKENGSGELLSYIPRNIKEIKVENTKSTYTIKSYTPVKKTKDENGKVKEETQETQYTLVGYEDMSIATGVPDAVANDAASLEFTEVVSSGNKDEKDFGFDKPQSTVTVKYDDKTTAVITVGGNAPASAGVYIKFGTGKEIYLVDAESVDSFLYGINDFMDLNFTDSATDGDNASPLSVTLGGTRYSDTITFVPSDDETASTNYIITSPATYYGDDQGCSKVEAGIRGLAATSAAYVNPSEAKLQELGLANPYATVDATYPDTTVSLIASKPDSKNQCFVMVKGGNVVYKILDDSIMWVKSSLDKLRSKYFVDNKIDAVSVTDVTLDGKNYRFELSGSGNTTSEVKCNGKNGNFGDFQTAFDFMHSADFYRNEFTNENPSGSPVMTVKFTYSGDRASDEMNFYEKGSKVYVTVNGNEISYVYKTNFNTLKKLFIKASE